MPLYRPRAVAIWTPPTTGSVIGTATASALVTPSDRDSLVLGVDEPTPFNTGALQPAAQLTDVTSNQTYTTNNQTITGKNFLGTVFVNASNVRFENCIFRGANSTPGDSSAPANCQQTNCVNAYFQDCEFYPQFQHWNWDSGVYGHDFTLDRCWIHHTTDGINVFNISAAQPYNTNVVIKQSLISDLVYWTAATGGVVHSDFATHNDGIQHQGGLGTQILGNAIHGVYARQWGHWVEGSVAVPPGGETEPYTGVALTSLPAGQPWYGGPFQASTSGGNTIPDGGGSGTEATGRYNVGGAAWQTGNTGSLSALLFGDEVGPSGDIIVNDNWFYGGEFAVNGGGALNTGSYTMEFRRNKFDRTQGSPVRSVNTNTTQTINFQQTEHSWTGFVTAPTSGADKNYYFDDNSAITVRT